MLIKHGLSIFRLSSISYVGVEKRDEIAEAHEGVDWNIAVKRGKIKKMSEWPLKDLAQRMEKLKAQIRSRVEHPFHIVKNLFKYRKVRYRGLEKNLSQLQTLFALANLVIAKRALMVCNG